MQILQHPSSTYELKSKSAGRGIFTCNAPGPGFSREEEIDTFEPNLEDLAVLKRIQSQAMAWLYERYAKFIYSLSLRILRDPSEAEDVMQEVLFRIWHSPDQLKIGKNLLPWIAVVSRNISIDKIRKRRPTKSIEDVVLSSSHDTARQAEHNLLCEKARVLIDRLPPEQRTVLEMAYFSGMTHSEIALSTGSPLGTIKTRIRDALKNLRKGVQRGGSASEMQSEKA